MVLISYGRSLLAASVVVLVVVVVVVIEAGAIIIVMFLLTNLSYYSQNIVYCFAHVVHLYRTANDNGLGNLSHPSMCFSLSLSLSLPPSFALSLTWNLQTNDNYY